MKRASAISRSVIPRASSRSTSVSRGVKPACDGGVSCSGRGPGGDGIGRNPPRFLDGLLQGQRPTGGPGCGENVGAQGVPEGVDVPTVEGAGRHDQGFADRVE